MYRPQCEDNLEAYLSMLDLPSPERVNFLGISVQRLKLNDLMELVHKAIVERKQWIIANHNLHSLYLFHHNAEFQRFFSTANWVHVDGMLIIALARLYGNQIEREHRVTYVDWLGPLMEAAARNGWRVFYLGSIAPIAEKARVVLSNRYPHLQLKVRGGYFNTDRTGIDNAAVLEEISQYKPHLLLVGMGMPRQEIWIRENWADLKAHVILPSGAAIDYIAGAKPTPPRWAGRLGLEWAFRLASEPRRLAHRYFVEPWWIAGFLARDLISRKLRQRPNYQESDRQ